MSWKTNLQEVTMRPGSDLTKMTRLIGIAVIAGILGSMLGLTLACVVSIIREVTR